MIGPAPLTLLLVACVVVAVAEESAQQPQPACPEPHAILPCVCQLVQYGEQTGMDMDCSQVADEAQLAEVFQADFPSTAFMNLKIYSNKKLRTLRKGDLGPASFQQIHAVYGVLEEVQVGALEMSYDTLHQLTLESNNFTDFHYHELTKFVNLEIFDLGFNYIKEFPIIKSESIKSIMFQGNPLRDIPVDAFVHTPNIQGIALDGCDLQEIKPDTFCNLAQLSVVQLHMNALTQLPARAIQVHGPDTLVWLSGNNITSIHPAAITVSATTEHGWLYFSDNNLTELPEEVYRPFFDAGNYVMFADNPLRCGCDLAWLVTNPEYLALLGWGSKCLNGTLITDLDPTMFIQNCS